MENSEQIVEDPFELAANSLFVFLNELTKKLNKKKYKKFMTGSIGDISQKTLILYEMLEFLQDNAADESSYTTIIELAVEARYIIQESIEESVNCLYDQFIDCTASALPENLSEDFRNSLKRS